MAWVQGWGPDTDMLTAALLRYSGSFSRETGIVLSWAVTPIDVRFNCMFLYCQDKCISRIASSRAVAENVTETLPDG